MFGPVSVFVGVTALLFHASFTAFLQYLDYTGMFVLLGLILACDLERIGWIEPEWAPKLLLGTTAASSAVFFGLRALGLPVQPLILFEALGLLALELKLWREFPGADFKPLGGGLGFMAGAVLCWLADYTRYWCDPADHRLQGHAAWHILTALAFLELARFYRQFRPLPPV